MRRFLCGLMCLCLLCTGISFAVAEDDEIPEIPGESGEAEAAEEAGLSEEEIEEVLELDADEPIERVTGKVYPVPTLATTIPTARVTPTRRAGPSRAWKSCMWDCAG